ncbi:MAG: OmpA family protein [Myxococcales bacterium]|nr:OmpA family protein [Myxococcales bacterium]
MRIGGTFLLLLLLSACGAAAVGDARPVAPRVESQPQPVESLPEPEPEPEPAEPVVAATEPGNPPDDFDGDGVMTDSDACPWLHAKAPDGCPEHLRIDEARKGVRLVSGPLSYDSTSGRLGPQNEAALGELAQALMATRELWVRAEAHTFESGDAEENYELSLRQARAVHDFLVARGVDPSQLEAYGCGMSRAVSPEAGWRRFENRRILIRLVRPLPQSGYPSNFNCRKVGAVEAEKEPRAADKPGAPAATEKPSAAPTALAKPAPRKTRDPDGDGLSGNNDGCPRSPGDEILMGCPKRHRLQLDAGRIELKRRVRFEQGEATLRRRGQELLDEVAATLRVNPEVNVRVEVHETDSELAQRRAAAVREYFDRHGVNAERVQAVACPPSPGAEAGSLLLPAAEGRLPPLPEGCALAP